jgi:hypothetical protein
VSTSVETRDPEQSSDASRPRTTARRSVDRPWVRLVVFAAAVAVLFGVGAAVGRIAGPSTPPVPPTAAGPVPAAVDAGGGAGEGHGGHDPGGALPPTADGLAVSQDGYTLETLAAPTQGGVPGELAFRITGPSGATVTAFTPTHDKPLHLIVVRRDQSGFAHLHPVMDAAGVWRIPLTREAGDHRIFVDFAPDGRSQAMTLGRDLPVAGDYVPRPLPAPSATATTPDGYVVTLRGALVPGTASPLTLSVSKDGAPVTDLQPYLAAYGHLVALRTGDLAYLHVHPEGTPGDGVTPPGPDVRFAAEVPTPGTYRLHLDFAHGGVVRTAEFTAITGQAAEPAAAHSEPAGAHGH